MTPELLVSIAAIILSLAFSYIPGLDVKFAALEGVHKRLVMLGLILATAAGTYGLSCAGWVDATTCDQEGIRGLVQLFIYAAVANQSAYMLSPETERVFRAKYIEFDDDEIGGLHAG
jgi:hypothetical protein